MAVVCIAGAGGIGSAVAVLLRQFYGAPVDIYIGDINEAARQKAVQWIADSGSQNTVLESFDMSVDWQSDFESRGVNVDIILDCLPGRFAPSTAKAALRLGAHYVNLTEYVEETKQIMQLAEGANTGFGLQSGVAPGFVNVLGKALFEEFCAEYGVEKANALEMRVGALGRNAVGPHFYNFTWSPIGVATEYIKPAEVVRDHQFTVVPSLSERRTVWVDGLLMEEELTSGGAADLPMTYQDQIANIDYKTFRYPGHWAWVDTELAKMSDDVDKIAELEKIMLSEISAVEEDLIIVYAAVEGKDTNGALRRIEASYRVEPIQIGKVKLRAIQSTTAAGMAEVARILLEGNHTGVLLQSQIDPRSYLNGPFAGVIYGQRR